MLDELDNLKMRVNGKGGIAFFHYGGHGVQVNGANYLIPVDADIPDEKKVATRTVNIDEVMSSLDLCESDTNIVILDACRNNPLPAGSGRSASRGLSVVGIKPKNSIIVYSAEAGTVAQDGLFTPTLAKFIQEKNISFSDILLKVRNEVNLKSSGQQTPGEYNQLFNNIYLNGIGNSINYVAENQTINIIDQFVTFDKQFLLTEWDKCLIAMKNKPLYKSDFQRDSKNMINGEIPYGPRGINVKYTIDSVKIENTTGNEVSNGIALAFNSFLKDGIYSWSSKTESLNTHWSVLLRQNDDDKYYVTFMVDISGNVAFDTNNNGVIHHYLLNPDIPDSFTFSDFNNFTIAVKGNTYLICINSIPYCFIQPKELSIVNGRFSINLYSKGKGQIEFSNIGIWKY